MDYSVIWMILTPANNSPLLSIGQQWNMTVGVEQRGFDPPKGSHIRPSTNPFCGHVPGITLTFPPNSKQFLIHLF